MDLTEAGQVVVLGDGVRRLLAPNPSAFTGPGTNTYLLGDGRAMAVIDPGPDVATHLDAILSAIGPGQVSHILVTHPHSDHSALTPALAAATGAQVYGFGPAGSGRSAQMRRLAAFAEIGGGEGSDATFSPDICLSHGDIITGDGWQLETLHCPGHMSEHLCFAMQNLLFSGDHVMGWSTSLVSPPDGDMAAYMATLEHLARRKWARFLPGHGAVIDDPATRLAELAAHRRRREAAILAALRSEPLTLAEITARVYADVAPALRPAAARNAFAHLVDLVEKGQVMAAPDLTPAATFGAQ